MSSTAELPPRFLDRTLETYEPETETAQKALAAAKRLAVGKIRSLVLIGQTGVGKSHLAAGVANAISEQIAEREGAFQDELAAWEAEREAIKARYPEMPPNDPASIAALEEWQAAANAEAKAKAELQALIDDHWSRQPKEPKPSPAWTAWHEEVPALEQRQQAVRALAPSGPRPFVGSEPVAYAAYLAASGKVRDALNAHDKTRPRRRRDPDPEWQNVAELMLELRAEFGLPPDDRTATLRVLALRSHRSLVVLDDLGREKASDWTGETVYALVNARYEALLPTLVTSNLTAAELAASPYWPVVSRLAEDGALIEVKAPDHRLRRRPA